MICTFTSLAEELDGCGVAFRGMVGPANAVAVPCTTTSLELLGLFESDA